MWKNWLTESQEAPSKPTLCHNPVVGVHGIFSHHDRVPDTAGRFLVARCFRVWPGICGMMVKKPDFSGMLPSCHDVFPVVMVSA